MRKKALDNSKRISEFKKILVQHINDNIKDYLILSIFFIIGVMVGVLMINKSDEQSKSDLNGYINGFISTVKDETYIVDKMKLVKMSALENLKMLGIVWLAGSTIIGIPLIYVIMMYKGFCTGYTISAIIFSLGLGKRNSFFYNSFAFSKSNYYSCIANVMRKFVKTI